MELSLVSLVLLFACGTPCDVGSHSWALVPDDALDCSSNLACLIGAVEDGEPAVAVTSSTGIDSVITSGRAWTGARYWTLRSDSMRPNRVTASECVDPSVTGTEITCARVEPEGNPYLVCGPAGNGSVQPLPFEP